MARLLLALLASGLLFGAGSAGARERPESFADLVQDLIPAVVHISMIRERERENGAEAYRLPPVPEFPEGSPFQDFFEDFFRRHLPQPPPGRVQPEEETRSLGSGFLLSADGLIVTNDHVIEGADRIEVTLAGGMRLPAEVMGRDAKTDLALLKVEAEAALPFVSFGDEEDVRVGDWVVAIGNPFGLGSTVTAGIVSGFKRDIGGGPYDSFIQTDAAINWGNSGGPLFDLHGRVIGINTKILSPSGGSVGIGFAIPASIASGVIEQLRAHGETRRGWLGVRIQEVSGEIAAGLGMDAPRGALVSGITPESPAQEAGIRAGDVIVRFAGQAVERMRDLPLIVAETRADRRVEIELWRDGRQVLVQARVGRLEEEFALSANDSPAFVEGTEKTGRVLGMTLAPMSNSLRRYFGIGEDVEGVVVEAVEYDSEAGEKQVRPGDVIVRVGHEAVTTPRQVRARIRRARAEEEEVVLLLLHSQDAPIFVALRLEKK